MKTDTKYNNIRNKVIDKAREHFAHFGLAKTSLNDIAQSLNMGKSSLYYYFQSKEQLFEAVVASEAEGLLAKVKQAVDAAAAPSEKIRAFGVAKTQYFREMSKRHGVFSEHYLQHYASIQKQREECDKKLIGMMKEILDAGVAAGEYRIDDTMLIAETVFLALKGMEYDWAMKSDAVDLERNMDKLLPLLLYGIKKTASGEIK